MKRLNVIYNGWGESWHLATLAEADGRIVFEYTPEAIRQDLQLSPLKLPLSDASYTDFPAHQMNLPGLLADALPDGWGLMLMDRAFRKRGLESPSPLQRLAFIGDRAMGALSFEPAEHDDALAEPIDLLALAKASESVLDGAGDDVLQQLLVVGGSPQGARPKALVYLNQSTGHMRTQQAEGLEPWLFKFPARGEHPDDCALEHAYAMAAVDSGLRMPATQWIPLARRHAAFGARRFDREQGLRVPMHTLAGLLHSDFRVPGVGYLQLLRATRFITRDQREVDEAFRRAVFNVAFHNRDDHAKNFSFILDRDRRWKLAPAYDLTLSEGPGGQHQMDVCGEGRLPSRTDLLRLANEGGVDPAQAVQILEQVSTVATGLAHRLADYPIRRGRTTLVTRAVLANVSRLAKQ